MAYRYSNSSSLGNGLEEIEFFSKDIDYDKELYESQMPEKDKGKNDSPRYLSFGKPKKYEDYVKIWESGGPIKILRLPDFDVYPLFFTNFQNLNYNQLKELLGNFFTLCEFENKDVRVTYRTEDDLRVGYQALKKDRRYHLRIKLNVDYFNQIQEDYKKNDINLSKNKRNQKLINQWINKGDVIIETSKHNCFPLQVKNYKELNYDELVELFSKYGKFTSIVQLENEYVQVKFCSEEAAQKCILDLKKDSRYNVKLLFTLKELNTSKKLIKEVVSSKLDAHVMQLLTDEDRIKFDPNQLPIRQSYVNQKHRKQKKLNTDNSNVEVDLANVANPQVICYKENCEHGNVYVKGTPFNNPYLTPPYSYKVWSNKKNHLPAPSLGDVYNKNNYVNYEY